MPDPKQLIQERESCNQFKIPVPPAHNFVFLQPPKPSKYWFFASSIQISSITPPNMPFEEHKTRVKSLSTPEAKKDYLNYAQEAAGDLTSSVFNLASAPKKGFSAVVIAGVSATSGVNNFRKCKIVGHELRDRGEVDQLPKGKVMATAGVAALAEGVALGIKLYAKSKGL